jgi:hypothetical protein
MSDSEKHTNKETRPDAAKTRKTTKKSTTKPAVDNDNDLKKMLDELAINEQPQAEKVQAKVDRIEVKTTKVENKGEKVENKSEDTNESWWGGITTWGNKVAEQLYETLDPEFEKQKKSERRALGIPDPTLPDIKGKMTEVGHVLEGATESVFKFFDRTTDLVAKAIEETHLQEHIEQSGGKVIQSLEFLGHKAMNAISETGVIKNAHANIVQSVVKDTSETESEHKDRVVSKFMQTWDNSAGMGHLTALDMLATQAESQLSSITPSAKALREFKAIERDLDTDVLLDDLESENCLESDDGVRELEDLFAKIVGTDLAKSLPLSKLVDLVKTISPTIQSTLTQHRKDIKSQMEAAKALELEADANDLTKTTAESFSALLEGATPILVKLTSLMTELLLRLAEQMFIQHKADDALFKPTKLALTVRLLIGKLMGLVAFATGQFAQASKEISEEMGKPTLQALNDDGESALALIQEGVRHLTPLIKLLSK